VSTVVIRLLLQLGLLVQPPVLPPEPEPPAAEAPAAEAPAAEAPALPPELEPVEFPLAPDPRGEQPLPRMDPPPATQAGAERRSIVDLRDPFNRPPVRPRNASDQALAQQRLLMPDLKDPFAEGTRPVRSRTLDLHVPSDLRDPFRDGLGRKRLNPCARTTEDGTLVQAPGAPGEPACSSSSSGETELHDPFRGDPPPPAPTPSHD
jgi:hypothetical protein